jgi:hypothetical protein
MWRIVGRVVLFLNGVVLIVGGVFWMYFWASMGVMVFDDPSATIVTYLHGVIPIAAPGLIAFVGGVGLLIAWNDSMWRIAGSVVLVVVGLFWMYYISSKLAEGPRSTNRAAAIIPAVAPGLIAVGVGVRRLVLKYRPRKDDRPHARQRD